MHQYIIQILQTYVLIYNLWEEKFAEGIIFSEQLFMNIAIFFYYVQITFHIYVHSLNNLLIPTCTVQMWENTDQKNSEYGHFSCSDTFEE